MISTNIASACSYNAISTNIASACSYNAISTNIASACSYNAIRKKKSLVHVLTCIMR